MRYSEPGLLHRNEPSGALHGLLRVRHFAQDDAHIFCTEEQVQDEVAGCLEMASRSTRCSTSTAPRALDAPARSASAATRCGTAPRARSHGALDAAGLDYELNPGDGAFYGPKIDMHMTDSLGRSWQLGTVQLDYSMPERFELTYTGADNAEHRPVMIHRALFGSFERFIGILHRALRRRAAAVARARAGDRAAGLRPLQRLRPRASRDELRARGVRVELDERSESIGRKIRDAELRKIPYMLVVGEREAANGPSPCAAASAPARRDRGAQAGEHRGERPRQHVAERVRETPRRRAILGRVDSSANPHRGHA